MLDGRRRPDRSWLRPLEASVASLPTLDFIRPEMARAAPLRRCGARVLPGALFFKVNLPPHRVRDVNESMLETHWGCLLSGASL